MNLTLLPLIASLHLLPELPAPVYTQCEIAWIALVMQLALKGSTALQAYN